MSENNTETTIEKNTAENTANQTSDKQTSACCKPHASLYISIIALLLAAYAAIMVSIGGNTAIQQRVADLDNRMATMDMQMAKLDQAVQSNRENLIQTKLKKALQNIQDISNIAEDGTKAAINEVEKMLQTLTTIGEQLNIPDVIESAIETVTEPATEADAPVDRNPESAAPADTAPLTESTPEATDPARSITEGSAITDNNPPTTEATPANTDSTPQEF